MAAVFYSVALKAANRDFLSDLNFGITCFSIKVFFHISKENGFATIISDTRAVQLVATCHQSPYLHKSAIVIVMSFSL